MLPTTKRQVIHSEELKIVRAIVTGTSFVPVPHRLPGPRQPIIFVVEKIEGFGECIDSADLRSAHLAGDAGLQGIVASALQGDLIEDCVGVSELRKQRSPCASTARSGGVDVNFRYRPKCSRANVAGLCVETCSQLSLHGEVV